MKVRKVRDALRAMRDPKLDDRERRGRHRAVGGESEPEVKLGPLRFEPAPEPTVEPSQALDVLVEAKPEPPKVKVKRGQKLRGKARRRARAAEMR